MIESLYAFLGNVGFHHPLHPALTHIPMGMVMGCFFFSLFAYYGKKDIFLKTSFHCAVLALIFIIPTILAGLLDWQHLYAGRYLPYIVVKMVLAFVLTGLLVYSVILHRKNTGAKKLFIVYCLCLVSAVGLGFSGGQLVYGG
ncbi:hypothetical protein JWJ90_04980 [Desulfobulbus rhabdoformis]|uniref:DUF2231 domain-containing protein n=1 Tax=Desulfobulbus rhabdoformis TaxID=34032 RepID=UPI001964219B|nr:DUF2231 domain-containing protein [Desulfobulbus rhabdoformis]MBM9613639.1 hypothetical protein [Desulfobulbus rhabdoformis]